MTHTVCYSDEDYEAIRRLRANRNAAKMAKDTKAYEQWTAEEDAIHQVAADRYEAVRMMSKAVRAKDANGVDIPPPKGHGGSLPWDAPPGASPPPPPPPVFDKPLWPGATPEPVVIHPPVPPPPPAPPKRPAWETLPVYQPKAAEIAAAFKDGMTTAPKAKIKAKLKAKVRT